MRKFARTMLSLAAATLGLGAAAQNTNTVSAWSNAGPVFDHTEVNLPAHAGNAAPVDMATWSGGESQFAAASGQTLSLHAVAATRGDNNPLQTTSSFNWTTPVLPGGSAVVGTPVAVTVSFRLDGSHAAGYGAAFSGGVIIGLPADFQLSSGVSSSLRLAVYDLDAPGNYTPGVFQPVPEPATWALMFVGLALLAGTGSSVRRLRAGGA